ncbi:MAG: acyl-CoA desaturase [Bacteroidota bacterium]
MEQENLNRVSFAPRERNSFMQVLASRVHGFLKANRISPYANAQMWVKTVIMLLLYFVPYALIVTGHAAGNAWLFFGLWFVMAWGMAGLGTSVMHDAHHGSYSSKKWVNNLIGYVIEIIGGYSVTWKIQHNELHHVYTNITGLDEDIDSIKLLRFSPRQPRYWYHRYQFLYVWFFYMLMTIAWITTKDFNQLARYRKQGLLARQNISYKRALFKVTLYKLLYYGYALVLPLIFSGMPWHYVVAGFLLMHFTAGLFLSCIFQPAHIVPASEFAAPVLQKGEKRMERSWAEHEVENTTNFALNNRFLTWFIGGLNYQIEHHLFTGICHVHYPRLAPIVRSVTRAFGLPYNVQPTFFKALADHVRMLKKLGRQERPA